MDNLGLTLYSVVSNTDPGTAGTNYYDYAQAAFGKTYGLSSFYAGTAQKTIKHSVDISKLVGMSIAQADSFRSVTTSIPTDLVYWGFGIYSNDGNVFTRGVDFEGFIELHIKFYARQDQLLAMDRISTAEWEADRVIWKMERDRQLSLLPEVAHPGIAAREQFSKKVQEIVQKKLAQKKSEEEEDDESSSDDPDVNSPPSSYLQKRKLVEEPEKIPPVISPDKVCHPPLNLNRPQLQIMMQAKEQIEQSIKKLSLQTNS
jgi:hypothetical protein